MEQEKQTNRVSRIEEFLLDPEKTLFELLEEFGGSVEEIRNALSQVDVANLDTLKGEDGKTPERGVDYFTDEDLDNIEAFILDRIPVVGEDVPSPKQVNEYIDKQIAKIPRVKGDKGNPGTPGKPGKDGSPDSALDIIKKLRSLDKNQGLQLNDIRGLVKKINLLNEVSEEFAQLKEDLSKIKILTSGAGSDGAGAVASVNGKTGVVVLTQDDIGDGVNYVRTENNFTDALLSKLTGLPTSYAFTGLTDTPASYTGQAGKFVKVNTNADGLEFASVGGGGDMLASVYDPTSISGDAFDMDNMVEGTNNKLVSSAEKTAWNDKLDDITGESIADLSDVDSIAGITDGKVLKWNTDKFVIADDDDTTYTASDFDIKDLTDSTNLRTTWSGKQDTLISATNIKTINGNSILGSGNIDTPDTTYSASDFDIKDLADSTSLRADWNAKEDASNKVTSFQATPDNTHYASEKLVKDSLDAKADANNVLALNNTAEFTPDGDYEPATKKYVDDNAGGKSVYEGTTPETHDVGWFLSEASYDSVNFSVSSQDGAPYSIAFKSDGSKMYMVGTADKKVYQYSLSTPWDLSTASYDSVNFSVLSQDTKPYGIAFKSDGSKMYMVGYSNKKVYQYSLSTPWDLSTASYDSVNFSVLSQETDPYGIAFKSDGSKMYMVGYSTGKVHQYSTARTEADAEIDCDTYDEYYLSAVGSYLNISITGTPTTGKTLFIGLKDNGATKRLNWSGVGEDYGSTLPTATTAGKQHIIELKHLQSAWRAIAVAEQE